VLLRIAPGLAISSGSDRPEFLTRDPERAAQYVADPLVHHLISARFHAAILEAQTSALSDSWPDLATLLVVPGDDPLVDAATSQRWAGRHTGVSVLVRQGGRHELHNDVDRTAALREIAGWVEARLAPEPERAERVLAPGS
jgi:acylglycerol lipase